MRRQLVPALMMMLGDSNWKLPAWLDRIIPQLNVEGASARAEGATVGAAVEPEPSVVG